ncbi:MAG: class I SAM-dependent methyltransferase [Aeromicrobium sp.]
MTSTASNGQWPAVAATWRLVGAPLRPSGEDLAFVRAAVDDWQREVSRPPRVLILGVTPELFTLPWPTGSVVRAADRTEEMVSLVWPGEPADVVLVDWLDMDWPDAAFDVVVCDGGWHLLDPAAQRRLATTLSRIIAPDGRFVVRLFVAADRPETPEDVMTDLLAGRVRDLNCLKLRLGPAMMESANVGVELDSVWQYIHDAAGDVATLAARLGWDPTELGAIDAYRDSGARYHFVSIEEFETTVCSSSTGFVVHRIDVPSYQLGDRCPTVVVRRAA